MNDAPRRSIDVLMDLTPRCNLYCKMCLLPIEEQHSKGAEMTDAVFERIRLEIFPRAKRVALSCGAEPFLSKRFFDAMVAAREAGVPHISYVTNGLLMTDEAIEKSIDAGVRRVWVSIDGATKETYERIRIGGKFDLLVERLEAFQRIRKERGVRFPELRLSWVLMRSNVDELNQLVELAHRVGVAEVYIRHLVPFEELDVNDELLTNEPERVNAALRSAYKRGRELGVRFVDLPIMAPERATWGQRLRLGAQHAASLVGDEGWGGFSAVVRRKWTHRKAYCDQPWAAIFIRPDGGVNPCGGWFHEAAIGHLADSKFTDIVDGENYQRLLDELDGKQPLRPVCQRCPNVVSGRQEERAFEVRSAWTDGPPTEWEPKVPKILERARAAARERAS